MGTSGGGKSGSSGGLNTASSGINTSDTTTSTVLTYSYLFVQIGLCEGEIEGISDIHVNNLPASYYSAVTYDYRLGTETQTIMPSFAAIETTTSINNKVVVGAVSWGDWTALYQDTRPVYGYVYRLPTGYSYKIGYYTPSVSVSN